MLFASDALPAVNAAAALASLASPGRACGDSEKEAGGAEPARCGTALALAFVYAFAFYLYRPRPSGLAQSLTSVVGKLPEHPREEARGPAAGGGIGHFVALEEGWS